MTSLKTPTTDNVNEELVYIQVSKIIPNRYQPRKFFDPKSLEDLAESIDVNGLLQPITVRRLEEPTAEGEEFELIAGERRLRAVKLLDKPRIKAIISEHTDKQSATMALVENLQRTDLNAIEEAYAIRTLMELGNYTQVNVAKQIGKSRSYVANATRLLGLPEKTKAAIQKGELESWHGLSILALPKEQQEEMGEKAVEKGWSVIELKKHIDKATGKDAIKEQKEEKEEKAAEIAHAIKHPVPKNYILIKLDDLEELDELLKSLKEAGLVLFVEEDIKVEIKKATASTPKAVEEPKAETAVEEPKSETAVEEPVPEKVNGTRKAKK